MFRFESFFDVIAAGFFLGLIALIVIASARLLYQKFHKISDWMTTTATMTGKTGTRIYGSRGGARYTYTEFEITYRANGQTYTKFFDFSPGPNPEISYPEGTLVSIRYRAKNPAVFEVLDVIDD